MPYSPKQYREDLATALYMAVGLSFIAAIPLALLGFANLVDLVRQRPLEVPWLTYLAVLLVVPASYAAAAITGGSAAFLLRPLRSHVLGWMFTGAVVAAAIYGSVGLALVAFYNPVGALFLEHSTRQEALEMIPFMLVFLAPVGAVVGAYMCWRKRQGRPVW